MTLKWRREEEEGERRRREGDYMLVKHAHRDGGETLKEKK